MNFPAGHKAAAGKTKVFLCLSGSQTSTRHTVHMHTIAAVLVYVCKREREQGYVESTPQDNHSCSVPLYFGLSWIAECYF